MPSKLGNHPFIYFLPGRKALVNCFGEAVHLRLSLCPRQLNPWSSTHSYRVPLQSAPPHLQLRGNWIAKVDAHGRVLELEELADATVYGRGSTGGG